MKLSVHDFQRRYKNSRSVGMRLANIKEELMREFEVEIYQHPNGQRTYTFKQKSEEADEAPNSTAAPESAPNSGSPSELEPGAGLEKLSVAKPGEKTLKEKLEAIKKKKE